MRVAPTAIVGSATFCVLGYAVATVIDPADSAQPMVQAIMLPLYFISGVFISNVKPAVLAAERRAAVSGRAPREALHTAFDPTTQAPGIVATDLGVLAIWAAAGPVVAVRRFRWTPAFAAA